MLFNLRDRTVAAFELVIRGSLLIQTPKNGPMGFCLHLPGKSLPSNEHARRWWKSQDLDALLSTRVHIVETGSSVFYVG